jgi:hypothetical protein
MSFANDWLQEMTLLIERALAIRTVPFVGGTNGTVILTEQPPSHETAKILSQVD